MKPSYCVISKQDGRHISTQARIANTFLLRLIGLMFRRQMHAQEALIFYKTPSIHTFFMRFAFDLVFLDDDDKIIRISIPSLSEERRKELVKVVKKMVEDCKVSLRNHRRDINEKLKKMKKDKDISEDDYFKQHEEVQKITDDYVSQCDKVFTNKEKEIIEF